jgi:hypothetical protein
VREVAVIGIGATKFGELWDLSFREIGIQAGLAAVYDANLSGEDIDALYVGQHVGRPVHPAGARRGADRGLLRHGPGQHPGDPGGSGRGVRWAGPAPGLYGRGIRHARHRRRRRCGEDDRRGRQRVQRDPVVGGGRAVGGDVRSDVPLAARDDRAAAYA